MYCCFFFFFKQKTAYEMRISDWSSDVCSSDLDEHDAKRRGPVADVIDADIRESCIARWMIGQIQQGGCHADQGEDRHDANGDLHRPAAFVDEYHRGASDQRDDDRRNDQMIDPIDHE